MCVYLQLATFAFRPALKRCRCCVEKEVAALLGSIPSRVGWLQQSLSLVRTYVCTTTYVSFEAEPTYLPSTYVVRAKGTVEKQSTQNENDAVAVKMLLLHLLLPRNDLLPRYIV